MTPSEPPAAVPLGPKWKKLKEELLAKAGNERNRADQHLLGQEDPDSQAILYALLLAFVHLNTAMTFDTAVEYCATIRMVTHQFFSLWDRTGGLPDELAYIIAGTIKEGNKLLEQVDGSEPAEKEKLKDYHGSCQLRWEQYKILHEQGREAARKFLAEKAQNILRNV